MNEKRWFADVKINAASFFSPSFIIITTMMIIRIMWTEKQTKQKNVCLAFRFFLYTKEKWLDFLSENINHHWKQRMFRGEKNMTFSYVGNKTKQKRSLLIDQNMINHHHRRILIIHYATRKTKQTNILKINVMFRFKYKFIDQSIRKKNRQKKSNQIDKLRNPKKVIFDWIQAKQNKREKTLWCLWIRRKKERKESTFLFFVFKISQLAYQPITF